MATRKKNGILVNSTIVLTSALTGLGIWAAVNGNQYTEAPSLQSVSVVQRADSNFDNNDAFLTQTSYNYVQPRTSFRLRTRAS